MHQTVLDFIRALEEQGRHGSVESYELALRLFDGWLERQGLDPLRATADHLRAYQRWLADEYRKENGQPLLKSTQVTRLTPVLSYYRWMEQRGLILASPGRKIKLPRLPRRQTPKDFLDLQEATALVQTQARKVLACPEGSRKWAEEQRDLAIVCLALATGRRRESLLTLTVPDLDIQRRELRVEWEKGMAGRVLPVAKWAVDVCEIYLGAARKRLLEGREDKNWLFPGSMNERVAGESFRGMLKRLHRRAAEENPDLDGFGEKDLSPHCLRVSFATLLFRGGCNIRSINELMLHRSLSTTARYTPIPLEDLRRACRLAHPRM